MTVPRGSNKIPRVIVIALLVGLIIGWTGLVWGQEISISQSVDRTEMAFEDSLRFDITLTWQGPPTAYRFEQAIRVRSEQLKVARIDSKVSSQGAGISETTTKRLSFWLSPELFGRATIDPVAVEYVSWPDSVPGTLTTDPVSVVIAQPTGEKKSAGSGIPVIWYIAFGFLVLVGVGLAVYSSRRGAKPKVKPQSAVASIGASLAALRTQAGGDLKVFQTGVYRLLIAYISERYGKDMRGKQAEEVVQLLASGEPDDEVREKLTTWLIRAEREKYSPVTPPPGEVIRLETEMQEFFRRLS